MGENLSRGDVPSWVREAAEQLPPTHHQFLRQSPPDNVDEGATSIAEVVHPSVIRQKRPEYDQRHYKPDDPRPKSRSRTGQKHFFRTPTRRSERLRAAHAACDAARDARDEAQREVHDAKAAFEEAHKLYLQKCSILGRRRIELEQTEAEVDRAELDEPDNPWNQHLHEMKEFVAQHGHFNVPHVNAKDPTPEQIKMRRLYGWCKENRREYWRLQRGQFSKMKGYRLRALESIKFPWNLQELQWDQKMEELKKYKEEKGDLLVPTKTELGSWVTVQRHQYKMFMLKKRMEMEERLASLAAGSSVGDKDIQNDGARNSSSENGNDATMTVEHEQEQPAQNEELRQPSEENGTKKKRKKEYTSSKDVKSQMTEWRVRRLNAIGFVWDANSIVGKGKSKGNAKTRKKKRTREGTDVEVVVPKEKKQRQHWRDRQQSREDGAI